MFETQWGFQAKTEGSFKGPRRGLSSRLRGGQLLRNTRGAQGAGTLASRAAPRDTVQSGLAWKTVAGRARAPALPAQPASASLYRQGRSRQAERAGELQAEQSHRKRSTGGDGSRESRHRLLRAWPPAAVPTHPASAD